MSTAYLNIGLDIIVLLSLGITIFYAMRLSKSLNNFRTYRREFDGLMQELNKHIEHAYEAVRTMKETSTRSGDDLARLYGDAQRMSDELKIINETSNSLANRLEALSTGGEESKDPDFLSTVQRVDKPKKKAKKKSATKRKDAGFAIQDREYDDDSVRDELQSDAERELYEALKDNNAL